MTFKKTSASWHRQVGAGLSFGQRLTIRLTVLISSKLKTLNDRLIKNLRILQEALAQESTETKRMLETYQKYLASQATEDEMAKANHQLRDLMKGLGLGVIVVLPFAPITLPLVLGLGRKFGVELLPSSFSKERKIKSFFGITDQL